MNPTQLQKSYLKLLGEFVNFKTISTDKSFQPEMERSVLWLEKLFSGRGFQVTCIRGKGHNPVVIAKYVKDPKLQTVLVYGHYDVQPASREDGWRSDPFVLKQVKDRFVARGVVDNKGQILAHMVAVFDAVEEGRISVNATFIIEGNEESGNPHLSKIIKKYKKLLVCDLILVSDGEMIGRNPTLDVSFRGGGNMRVVYQTSSNDRHSGLFGGSIPNAALELAKVLAKIKVDNKVSFDSFYVSTLQVSSKQKKANRRLADLLPIAEVADVRAILTEVGLDAHSQIGLRPTIEVSGFSSGYTGVGFKNIIPAKAEARLNIRTVHPQSSAKVMREVERFIKRETPAYVRVLIEREVHGDPIFIDSDHERARSIKGLLRQTYGREVLCQSVGGSIPVVADFKSILQKPMVLVPLSNHDCNMHGVGENFSKYHINKALEFAAILWRSF